MVGPGFVETDLGVVKEPRIRERVTSVFSAGSAASNYVSTPVATAGQITSLVGSGGLSNVARQTQFSVKFLF